jgi:flagellar basal body-associated protein FliL
MSKEKTEKPNAAHGADKPKGAGGSGKAMIIGFVSLVVLLETALFFFLIPSAEDVAALAEARLVQKIKEGETTEEEKKNDEKTIIEFPLGQFGVVFSPVDSERSFRVEFNLFALLRKLKESSLKEEYKLKEGRIRHEVLMKVRTCTLEELQENNLGSIQRRILATCNQLLNEPVLLSVGFQDFQVSEQ